MKLNPAEKRLILKVARGLIAVAETAMPDSYLATDSRVKAARKLIKLIRAQEGRLARLGPVKRFKTVRALMNDLERR